MDDNKPTPAAAPPAPFRFSEEERRRLEDRRAEVRRTAQQLPTPQATTATSFSQTQSGFKRRARFMTAAWMLGVRIAHLAQKFGISPPTVNNIIGREIPAGTRDQLRRSTGVVSSYEQLDAIYAAFYSHAHELEDLPLPERTRRLREYVAATTDTLEPDSRIGEAQS